MHYGWVIVAACLVIGVCGYGRYGACGRGKRSLAALHAVRRGDRGRRRGRLVALGLDRLALVRRTARPGARARRIGQRVRRLYRAARRVSDRDRRLASRLCLAGCDLGRPDCAGRILLVRDPAARGSMPYGANAGEISPAPDSGRAGASPTSSPFHISGA